MKIVSELKNTALCVKNLKLKAFGLLLFAVCLSCTTRGEDEGVRGGGPGWEITIHGKVGYPQAGGQITITEMKDGVYTVETRYGTLRIEDAEIRQIQDIEN